MAFGDRVREVDWGQVAGDVGAALSAVYGDDEPTTVVVESPDIPWGWIAGGTAVVLVVIVLVVVLASR